MVTPHHHQQQHPQHPPHAPVHPQQQGPQQAYAPPLAHGQALPQAQGQPLAHPHAQMHQPAPPDQRAPQPAQRRRFDVRAQQARIAAAFRPHHGRKRLVMGLLAIGIIWLMAAAYFVLMPSTYISRWTLILPAANSGSSMTLETIGQASTNPGQPFGSVTLSPKVIYREISTSDQVRQRAAEALRTTPLKYGHVRVRLIDETSLMLFQITGSTAEEAQAKGRAHIAALAAQLDILRRDEFEKRASLVRENLKLYQATLDRSRERIIDFQRSSGLLSLQQFNDAATTAELLRRRLAERRTELEKVLTEQRRLVARIGLPPEAAAVAIKLVADPAFARLAATFAEGTSAVHENALRFGPNHPALAMARQKRDGALAEIQRIAARAEVTAGVDLPGLALMIGSSQQGDLLRAIVAGEALLTGLRGELQTLEQEVRRVEAEVARMGNDAARLESLKKDHLVAEAVFTSAAARLDTTRSDLYSSYPLVQVLAEPDLPETRTQPRLSYALAAGMLGTLIVMLAWVAAWVGVKFSRRRSGSV